jgi:hypothetical protein
MSTIFELKEQSFRVARESRQVQPTFFYSFITKKLSEETKVLLNVENGSTCISLGEKIDNFHFYKSLQLLKTSQNTRRCWGFYKK